MPVAPHLQNLDTELDIAKLQLGFLDFVVAPLWNAWQAEKDRLTAAEPTAPPAHAATALAPAPEL